MWGGVGWGKGGVGKERGSPSAHGAGESQRVCHQWSSGYTVCHQPTPSAGQRCCATWLSCTGASWARCLGPCWSPPTHCLRRVSHEGQRKLHRPRAMASLSHIMNAECAPTRYRTAPIVSVCNVPGVARSGGKEEHGASLHLVPAQWCVQHVAEQLPGVVTSCLPWFQEPRLQDPCG